MENEELDDTLTGKWDSPWTRNQGELPWNPSSLTKVFRKETNTSFDLLVGSLITQASPKLFIVNFKEFFPVPFSILPFIPCFWANFIISVRTYSTSYHQKKIKKLKNLYRHIHIVWTHCSKHNTRSFSMTSPRLRHKNLLIFPHLN